MTVANSRQLYLHQTIPVVEGDVIDGIAVCYNTFAFAPVDRPPFITAILLTEVLFPAEQHGQALRPHRSDQHGGHLLRLFGAELCAGWRREPCPSTELRRL
jgi:hypothetical protein